VRQARRRATLALTLTLTLTLTTLTLALTLTLTLTLNRRGAVHAAHVLLVLVQLFVTIGAFSTTIFLRQCRGALAHGLREKGIDFDGAHSMAQT
jgi:hypothetical protein